jgi:hypothetical protein
MAAKPLVAVGELFEKFIRLLPFLSNQSQLQQQVCTRSSLFVDLFLFGDPYFSQSTDAYHPMPNA